MNVKKFMAVFAVLIMASASIVVITANVPDSESAELPDRGTVLLNVNQDYRDNAQELSKLDVGPQGWVKTDSGYKLVLTDVSYSTNAPYAILAKGKNATLDIECHGENFLGCKGIDDESVSSAIYVENGQGIKIRISGDGELVADSQVADKVVPLNSIKSAGIYVDDLEIEGCAFTAMGSDIDNNTIISLETDGIIVNNSLKITNTYVWALGGDIKSTSTTSSLKSYGVLCENAKSTLTMNSAKLFAYGGEISATTVKISEARSLGVDAPIVTLNGSVLRGFAGDIACGEIGGATQTAYSCGIMIDKALSASQSEVNGRGGDVTATSAKRIWSAGVYVDASEARTITITETDFHAYGAKVSGGTNYSLSLGFIADGNCAITLNFTGCVIEMYADPGYGNSIGMTTFELSSSSAIHKELIVLSLNDSEFYANGDRRAYFVDSITVAEGWKWSGVLVSGKWEYKAPTELAKSSSTYVTVGYKYDVYYMAFDDVNSQVIIKRVAIDKLEPKTVTLSENKLIAPEGKQFKCWSVDGVEMNPGETITVMYYAMVYAVWEDAPEPVPPEPTPSSDDNTGMVIGGVVVAIIVVFAFAMVWLATKK